MSHFRSLWFIEAQKCGVELIHNNYNASFSYLMFKNVA